jgi:glycosyltransferase involved in cell wall biosynthesis
MSNNTPSVVLQVLPALDGGGVERGTLEIAAALVAAGRGALVASAGGRLVAPLEALGARHIPLPLATKSPLAIWRNAAALEALIRREHVTLVHARSRAPAWSAWLAARRAGVPFITTYHAAYNEKPRLKRAYNAIMARGEIVIAISHFVAGLIVARHAIPPARIRVIPRGVDPTLFDPAGIDPVRAAALAASWSLPPGAPVLLLPGRLTRWKGQEILIAALARMRHRDAVAVLLGGDQGRARYVAALHEQARHLGVADRLRLVGHSDDVPTALSLATLVVCPSLEPEGFGRTVIEGQAMARPVVVSDHGGAAETVESGRTGWRIPPGDATALAQTLDAVLDLPVDDRARLGAAARASVLAHYTTAQLQAATLAAYDELDAPR